MSAISAMPGAVTAWLKEQPTLAGIGFLTEFPAANKAVPLRSPLVAVGLDRVEIVDKFVANDDGVLERQEYCRTASLRLRLGIHVPFSAGGDRCHEIFASVLDLLSFASDLNLRQSGCEDITAHRDTDAFVLEAWADVLADFCPAESTGLTLGSFLSKELLCGSHIRDEALHLSPAEKSWLEEPYAIGTYFGNGTTSQNVSVGLQPRTVFVMAIQLPHVITDYTNHSTQLCFGFATPSGGSLGLELTSGGFRLRSGSGVSMGGIAPALNLPGTQYIFVALK